MSRIVLGVLGGDLALGGDLGLDDTEGLTLTFLAGGVSLADEVDGSSLSATEDNTVIKHDIP